MSDISDHSPLNEERASIVRGLPVSRLRSLLVSHQYNIQGKKVAELRQMLTSAEISLDDGTVASEVSVVQSTTPFEMESPVHSTQPARFALPDGAKTYHKGPWVVLRDDGIFLGAFASKSAAVKALAISCPSLDAKLVEQDNASGIRLIQYRGACLLVEQ